MVSDPFGVAAMGILTGIIAIVGSLVLIMVIVLATLRSRRQRAEMLHKERMLAIEKGLPVPTDYAELPRKRPYVAGLVWAAVGVGVFFFGLGDNDSEMRGMAMIPLFVGIALLIGDWITMKRESRRSSGSGSYPPAAESYRGPGNPS